ncbi:MAG TPA: glycosyltransferase 87 family protein [Pseudolysinimonas sp.]|nr:glycosyltransferase 87 family protein [Pseudolysinimonas sp.]
MTDAAPRPHDVRTRLASLARSPFTLWVGFVLVHFWLGALALYGPGYPLGDVNWVYKFWVEHGLVSGQWVGLQTSWVYPIVALLPMLTAYAFGPALYTSTWLSLIMVVDAAAFAVVMGFGRDRRVAHVAWWWLALLVSLGPVAVGRIDAVAVAVAIVGLLCLASAPRLAGVLLAVAAWIKVWPAALVAGVFIAVTSRVRVVLAALVTSAVILVVSIALGGGGANAFSFITQQTGRGLQIESGLGTFWMWDAFTRRPGASTIYYDSSILTYQLHGPGVQTAAAVATPLLALVALALLLLAIVIVRRGASAAELLPPLALAITAALIVFNKVGSPQFVTWLAVPIVFGLSTAATGRGSSFRFPAVLALVIAALTQMIYPSLYQELLALNVWMLLVLTVRNLLFLVLLGWAVWTMLRLVRPGVELQLVDESNWLPRVWPFVPERGTESDGLRP